MTVVKFKKLIDTAILPIKEKIDEPQFHDESSKWIKSRRIKGMCWPYRRCFAFLVICSLLLYIMGK